MIMYMKNIEIKLKHTIFLAFIPFYKLSPKCEVKNIAVWKVLLSEEQSFKKLKQNRLNDFIYTQYLCH